MYGFGREGGRVLTDGPLDDGTSGKVTGAHALVHGLLLHELGEESTHKGVAWQGRRRARDEGRG